MMKFKTIDESRFDEMRDILPPALDLAGRFLVGECADHFGPNGEPRFASFFSFKPDAFEQRFYSWRRDFWESVEPMTIAEFRAVTVDAIRANLLTAEECAAAEYKSAAYSALADYQADRIPFAEWNRRQGAACAAYRETIERLRR